MIGWLVFWRENWRGIWAAAEMTFRQQVMDAFIIFTILVQPLIIALLALWMLGGKGSDYIMFVVVGSGMTGLWSGLLFMCGNSITWERWSGTLETLVGVPTPLDAIVIGKNLANVSQSLASMVVKHLLALVIFGYSLTITQPAAVCRFAGADCGGLHQLGLIIAPICDESRRAAMAERAGISGLHPERVSVSDRAAAQLDDAVELLAAHLLGGARAARHVERECAGRGDAIRLGHDDRLQRDLFVYRESAV
jgi:hypothetical protein